MQLGKSNKATMVWYSLPDLFRHLLLRMRKTQCDCRRNPAKPYLVGIAQVAPTGIPENLCLPAYFGLEGLQTGIFNGISFSFHFLQEINWYAI